MRGGLLGWYVLLAGGLGALGWLAAGAQGGAPEGAQRVPVGPPGAAASMPLLPLEDADAVEVGGGERGNASLLPDGTYSPFDPTLRRYWQERAKRLAARNC
jgi:hypothetical protein